METSLTKSMEIDSLAPPEARTGFGLPLLRVLVELRRLGAVLGFAVGFVGILLFLNYSGISALAPNDDVARAFPNPAPNAAVSIVPEQARPVPPLFPNPRHQ